MSDQWSSKFHGPVLVTDQVLTTYQSWGPEQRPRPRERRKQSLICSWWWDYRWWIVQRLNCLAIETRNFDSGILDQIPDFICIVDFFVDPRKTRLFARGCYFWSVLNHSFDWIRFVLMLLIISMILDIDWLFKWPYNSKMCASIWTNPLQGGIWRANRGKVISDAAYWSSWVRMCMHGCLSIGLNQLINGME